MNGDDLTISVRVLVDGADVPLWRVKLLGICARALGVPLSLDRLAPAVPRTPHD